MGESILFPWLLYSHGKEYIDKTLCNIASSTHQSYASSIPALEKKNVLGSSHGWLILKMKNNTDNKTAADFYSLWNPITLESIDFPPFNSNPEHVIISFLLSSPPGDDDPNCMLLLFEAAIPAIFVCRISNPEWIELSYGNSSNKQWIKFPCGKVDQDHLHSPVSYNGEVFATRRRHILFRIDIKDDNTIFLHPLINLPLNPTPRSYFWRENLVECCGDLYTVYCTMDCAFGKSCIQNEIVAIHVFKLNFAGMIWDKVDNIDNHAFFVSKNIAISCPADALSSFPSQRNRIYFNMEEDYVNDDDDEDVNDDDDEDVNDDNDDDDKCLFSYHVEDGTLTISRPCPDLPQPRISPIWVTLPTLGTNKGEQREEVSRALVFAAEERKDDEKYVIFPWTDLPMDLQKFISEKLPPFDYLNFRASCRSNLLIAPPVQWRTKFSGSDDHLQLLSPCLIYSPIGKNVCNILDPNLNGRYLVKTPKSFQDPIVRCCKENWLLMSESEEYSEDKLSMFLFNPFTKDIIQLPDLEVENTPAVRFSLTSLPYSSNRCYVVCFLNRCTKANILVTSLESEEWTFIEFPYDTNDFYLVDNVPVFSMNTFYYLGEEEKLGILRMEEGWSWQVWDVKGRPEDFQQNYLVEWNGRLLSVFVGDLGKWVKVFMLCIECIQNNPPSIWWEPVLDLGNHVIYLSRLATLCKVAQVEGMENRIYFERLHKERAIFYSLSTQKFHTTDGKDSLTSYYNTSEPLLCAWIEPSWC